VPELDRRMLTRQGKAVAWAKGRFKGRQSMLSASRQAHLLELHAAGAHAVSELPELFEVSRLTVYRVWERAQAAPGGTAVWAC
jgi:DNA invertase Pin-like site-specific DNA recombinase